MTTAGMAGRRADMAAASRHADIWFAVASRACDKQHSGWRVSGAAAPPHTLRAACFARARCRTRIKVA